MCACPSIMTEVSSATKLCYRLIIKHDLLHMCACSHPHSVPSDDHNKYNVIIILCVQTVGTGMHVI